MDTWRITGLGIGQASEGAEIEARGYRWLVYRQVRRGEEHCYMTNGTRCLEIRNPQEWQEFLTHSYRLTGSVVAACDMACERLRMQMARRGDDVDLASAENQDR